MSNLRFNSMNISPMRVCLRKNSFNLSESSWFSFVYFWMSILIIFLWSILFRLKIWNGHLACYKGSKEEILRYGAQVISKVKIGKYHDHIQRLLTFSSDWEIIFYESTNRLLFQKKLFILNKKWRISSQHLGIPFHTFSFPYLYDRVLHWNISCFSFGNVSFRKELVKICKQISLH